MQVTENLVTVKNNITVLSNAGLIFYGYGQRDKAEEVSQVIKELAATTGEVHHIAASHLADCVSAFYDGRLEETVEILESDLAWRREVGLPDGAGVHRKRHGRVHRLRVVLDGDAAAAAGSTGAGPEGRGAPAVGL